MKQESLKAHIAIGCAMVIFGMMAPFAKDVANTGITGLQLATFRIVGAALMFWLIAPFTPQCRIEKRDIPKFLLAGLLGVVLCQGLYIIGVSITSPVNASIEVTAQPIFTMILAAVIIGEPITWRKAAGVFLGFAGAVILILVGTRIGGNAADFRGDLLVLTGQLAFAFYLTLFQKLIRKYNVFTFNRWLFTFGALILLPFTFKDMLHLDKSLLTPGTVAEISYIIIACTFITFMLVVYAQGQLRPTVVSSYNYIQPVVTVIASLIMGIAIVKWQQLLAAVLIFFGVWLVITSKSKADMTGHNEKQETNLKTK